MMKSVVQFAALTLITVVVAGCLGAGPLQSPTTTVAPAATATAGTSIAPSPTATPNPTATPGPTATPSPTVGPGPTITGECPPPPAVEVLGGWTPAWPPRLLAACFGNREIEVTGYLAPAWGIGGLGNGVVPSWLGEWSGLPSVLWLRPHPADGCPAPEDCMWMFLFAPAPASLPMTSDRWVTLTGHFNDPVALTCRATGSGPDAVKTNAEAVDLCREHFVVTQIRTVAAPSP